MKNAGQRLGFSARARGALLGLAVGDALGTTLEFTEPGAPPFPTLATGPHRSVCGGGPFDLAPGQVTDDGQMATCLAASLLACDGFDAADVEQRYAEWSGFAFDIGSQTSAALRAGSGRSVWEEAERNPAGNGSLMRTAPLAVWFARDTAERRRASLAESAITHFDPRCQLACAAFNAAIAAALFQEADEARMLTAAHDELVAGAAQLLVTYPELAVEIGAARAALVRDLALAGEPDPQLYGPELHLHAHQGFVRVAFRLAFWELVHAPSWREALVDVVNRGGDADTNGAITGALLGAAAGEDEIPAPWRERTLNALAGEAGPFATVYHPRVLLALVERVAARE